MHKKLFFNYLVLLSGLLVLPFTLLAQNHSETLHVVTHNRETVVTDPAIGLKHHIRWGVFPDETVEIRKIIMHVKFGCPDTMRCADWDYSDRISLLRKGGINGQTMNIELGRMLTPYGGTFGKDWRFDWEVDVTDFSLLLRDSVEIDFAHSGYEPAHDRGWAVTVDFEIITGKEVRKPLSIKRIYDYGFAYGNPEKPISDSIAPVPFQTSAKTRAAILRIVQTGHGMDKPDNCAEFCNKYREIYFDNTFFNKKQLWLECGDNPCFPQAGTWVFDRANWCPGYLMQPERYELPVKPSSNHQLQFRMQDHISDKPSAVQAITAYIIEYGPYAAKNDACIEDVVVPSIKPIYSRRNPAGHNPVIRVKNNGGKELKSLKILYGRSGHPQQTYKWKGSILPGNSLEITLPGRIEYKNEWNGFTVKLDRPNGRKDAWPQDNEMLVWFRKPPVHSGDLVFYLLTNKQPEHNSWRLVSSDGKTVAERTASSLQPATEYRDTFNLSPGSYSLFFSDTAGDGLEFWFNATGGMGLARLLDTGGNLLRAFESDCGNGWTYNFVVGGSPDLVSPDTRSILLYPGRTSDTTRLYYFSNQKEDVVVRLISDPGSELLQEHHYPSLKEGIISYDLSKYAEGRFYLKVLVAETDIFSKRIRLIKNN